MFKKITLVFMLIILATSCGSQRNEATEAYSAQQWLVEKGFKKEELDKLNNRRIIALKEAVERGELKEAAQEALERGETSFIFDGMTVNIVPGRPALKDDPYHPDNVRKRQAELEKLKRVMESELREAERLGYNRLVKVPPFESHGQRVYTNGKDFISRDIDSHSGGVWKKFDRRGRRLGTYDANLGWMKK